MTNPRDAQTAPELDDKPDTIWVRVTDKSIMTRKPSDADEFDVEYRRADTLSGARMGVVVVAARKFLNDANSAWAAGEPLHKVRTMLDAADDLQAALDALQPGEAQGADDHSLLAAVLRSRGKSNTLHDIMRAADMLDAAPPAAQVTATDLERIAADFEKDSNLDRYICCGRRDCGCQGATAGVYAAYKIRALAGDGK